MSEIAPILYDGNMMMIAVLGALGWLVVYSYLFMKMTAVTTAMMTTATTPTRATKTTATAAW